jgi:transposase InsO family protein
MDEASRGRARCRGEEAVGQETAAKAKVTSNSGRRFETVAELRRELHRYVAYYNHKRLHSALSYQSPVDCEQGAA